MIEHADIQPLRHHLLRRSSARAAILEAGRTLATREGVNQLSLSAVAAEAGFGPSTVFGHFRNKDELLLAVVAEDLSSLAALMRGSPEAGSFDPPRYLTSFSSLEHAAVGQTEPHPGEFRPADSTPEAGSLGEPFRSLSGPCSQGPMDSGQEAACSDMHAGTSLKHRLGTDQGMAEELEGRLTRIDTDPTKLASLSNHAMTNLLARMEAFQREQNEAVKSVMARVEETERRQRAATAEVRAAINDTATRIEILESKLREAPDRAFGKRQNRSTVDEADFREGDAKPQAQTADQFYAAAAQRAADAAAALAKIQPEPGCQTSSSRWGNVLAKRIRFQRRYVAMAASIILIVFAVGAYTAFYVGTARGREIAMAAQADVTMSQHHHLSSRQAARSEKASVGPSERSRLQAFAPAGSAKAELILGLKYLHGEGGVAPDLRLAAQLIRRAAEQHDPVGQYWLGTLYDHGDGVAADATEAVRWYEAAAGQGNRKAMHALGVSYAQGLGTQKDYSEAARWFTRAAELGLVNSQFNLGVLYERGLGVPQSLLDAYKWYAIAAAQGDSESRSRIEVLKTQLSADDLAAAEGAGFAFQPQHVDPEANNLPMEADLSLDGRR
ncbi:MAG: SEL1-like repeat protein [Alphaproteobacteria bacterium]|nr:SEL1-like repeat protein [Alphaproteobacteria bacterium]